MGNRASQQVSFRQNMIQGISSVAILGLDLMVMFRILLLNLSRIAPDTPGIEVVMSSLSYAGESLSGAGMFFMIALARGARALSLRRGDRLLALKNLVYAAASLAACVLLAAAGSSETAWKAAGALYVAAALASRVIAYIRTRKKANIPAMIMLLALLVTFHYAIWGAFILIFVWATASILSIAFSRIRLDVLRDILKKTYAAEILFGLILLILAFSLVLPILEDSISNFGEALWYCFAIVTTIGFGDVSATTVIGRILSVILGIYGIIVVALITSVIVNFYGEMKHAESDTSAQPEAVDGRQDPLP